MTIGNKLQHPHAEQLVTNLLSTFKQKIVIHMCTYTHCRHAMVPETSQTTCFQACFFCRTLYAYLLTTYSSV